MATTLKLKKSPTESSDNTRRPGAKPSRPPVRGAGSGVRQRPTLAEAQAQRAEREAAMRQERQEPRREPKNPAPGQRPDARRPRPADDRRPSPPSRGPGRTEAGRGQRGDARPGTGETRDRPSPRSTRPAAPPSRDTRPPAHAGSPSKAFEPSRRDDAPPRPRSGNTAFGRVSAPPREASDASEKSPPARAYGDSGRVSDPARPATRGAAQARQPRTAEPTFKEDRAPKRSTARPAPPVAATVSSRARKPASAAETERRTPEQPAPEHALGSVRLSKRMSELGLASRREADEWIEKGWVRVDGEVVRELGSRVLPGQAVTIDGQARQQQARQVTVLLNKPIGFVSGQAEDGYEPAFVLVTPQNQWREDGSGVRFHRDHLRSLVPAGRLDIDSTGLLVLTQDGRVAKALIGEDSPVDKEYLVRVQSLEGGLPAQQALSAGQLAQLNHGLELDGQPLRPAKVEWVNEDQLRFVLVEGKKRQIRRMCEAVGLKVTGLKRVRIGRVMLGDLPVGQWRYLRGDEAF